MKQLATLTATHWAIAADGTKKDLLNEFNFIMADLLRPWVAPDAYKSDDDDRASDLEK